MAIANLANVPGNPAEMAAWSFAHMAHHRDMISAVRIKYAIELPEYALDLVNLNDPGPFEDNHQLMHNDLDAILGTYNYDLTSVDLTNVEQRASWVYLNFQSHQAEGAALGVP